MKEEKVWHKAKVTAVEKKAGARFPWTVEFSEGERKPEKARFVENFSIMESHGRPDREVQWTQGTPAKQGPGGRKQHEPKGHEGVASPTVPKKRGRTAKKQQQQKEEEAGSSSGEDEDAEAGAEDKQEAKAPGSAVTIPGAKRTRSARLSSGGAGNQQPKSPPKATVEEERMAEPAAAAVEPSGNGEAHAAAVSDPAKEAGGTAGKRRSASPEPNTTVTPAQAGKAAKAGARATVKAEEQAKPGPAGPPSSSKPATTPSQPPVTVLKNSKTKALSFAGPPRTTQKPRTSLRPAGEAAAGSGAGAGAGAGGSAVRPEAREGSGSPRPGTPQYDASPSHSPGAMANIYSPPEQEMEEAGGAGLGEGARAGSGSELKQEGSEGAEGGPKGGLSVARQALLLSMQQAGGGGGGGDAGPYAGGARGDAAEGKAGELHNILLSIKQKHDREELQQQQVAAAAAAQAAAAGGSAAPKATTIGGFGLKKTKLAAAPRADSAPLPRSGSAGDLVGDLQLARAGTAGPAGVGQPAAVRELNEYLRHETFTGNRLPISTAAVKVLAALRVSAWRLACVRSVFLWLCRRSR